MVDKTFANLFSENPQGKTLYYQDVNDLTAFLKNEILIALIQEVPLTILHDDSFDPAQTEIASLNSLHQNYAESWSSYPPNTASASIDFSYFKKMAKVSSTIQSMHSKIFGDWTFLDIIKLTNDIKAEIEPYPFNISELTLEFTPSEFYDLNNVITQFINFSRYHNQDGLKARILSTYNSYTIRSQDIQDLNVLVRNWYNSLNEIKKELLTGMNVIEAALENSAQQHYVQSLANLEGEQLKVNEFIQSYSAELVEKPSMLSFDNTKKARFKAWTSLIEDSQYIEEYDPSQALQNLLEAEETLLVEFNLQKSVIVASIKSINDLNTENTTILTASKNLTKVIDTINSHQLFLNVQECNAVSISKKIDFIEQLKYKLEIFLQGSNIQNIIEWYETAEKLDSSFIKFLNQLKSCPIDEWRYQFEYYYLNSILKKQNVAVLRMIGSSPLPFIDTILAQYNTVYDTTIASYNSLLDQRIEVLRKSNKTLFKAIKSGSISIDQVKTSLDFPFITFCNIKDTESMNAIVQNNEKTIAIINNMEGNPKNVTWLISTEEYQYEMVPFQVELQKSLRDTNITKQLGIAKKLSYNIFPYLNNIRAYQLKIGNIISLVDNHWQESLAETLEPFGKKEFGVETHDHLTDFILSTDRQLYIIVQDGMLNPQNNDFLTQFSIMSQCMRAGIEFIELSTLELYKDEKEALHNILKVLGLESPQSNAVEMDILV